MKRSRKPYPDEFKQEAVRLLREQRLPHSQVARDLGVDPETLRRWARELAPDNSVSQDSALTPPVSAAELARLVNAAHPRTQLGACGPRTCLATSSASARPASS